MSRLEMLTRFRDTPGPYSPRYNFECHSDVDDHYDFLDLLDLGFGDICLQGHRYSVLT